MIEKQQNNSSAENNASTLTDRTDAQFNKSNNQKKALTLCVTGPMAAGKNAACDILTRNGFICIDADLTAHTAVENSKEKILEVFGKLAEEKQLSLINENGTVNRRALGQLIFKNEELVRQHEQIVFPEINRLLQNFLDEHINENTVINATVLYKVPLINSIDCILYIDAPLPQRFFRALKRDRMKPAQILDRFARQKNLFAKYQNSNADIRRVWNTGSRKSLEKKIKRFLTRCR